jgi:hypothetical protein
MACFRGEGQRILSTLYGLLHSEEKEQREDENDLSAFVASSNAKVPYWE